MDDENKAKAEAARKLAEEKNRLAMEAMQQRDGTDLAASERAEVLVMEAKQADSTARRAENTKASAKGELMAQYGWTNVKQAETYTKGADRKLLGIKSSRRISDHIENKIPRTAVSGEGKIKNN